MAWLFTKKTFRKHLKLIFPHRDFIICIVSLAIFHRYFVIGIFPFAFYHPHFSIRIFLSAIRHPVLTLQRSFAGLGSLRKVKMLPWVCGIGQHFQALGHSFLTIRTSQPANSRYLIHQLSSAKLFFLCEISCEV